MCNKNPELTRVYQIQHFSNKLPAGFRENLRHRIAKIQHSTKSQKGEVRGMSVHCSDTPIVSSCLKSLTLKIMTHPLLTDWCPCHAFLLYLIKVRTNLKKWLLQMIKYGQAPPYLYQWQYSWPYSCNNNSLLLGIGQPLNKIMKLQVRLSKCLVHNIRHP